MEALRVPADVWGNEAKNREGKRDIDDLDRNQWSPDLFVRGLREGKGETAATIVLAFRARRSSLGGGSSALFTTGDEEAR